MLNSILRNWESLCDIRPDCHHHFDPCGTSNVMFDELAERSLMSPLTGTKQTYVRLQARIQGKWNGWIFTPFFWSPFFLRFSYPSIIEIIFDFSLTLSPPISKSWIRPWASHCNILTRLNFNFKISRFLQKKKCYLKIFNFLTSNMFEFSRVNTFNSYLFCSSFLFFHPQHWTLSVRTFAGKSKFSQRIQITSSWLQSWVWDDY